MCGHGTCINVRENDLNYKCICDPGWTTSYTSQACVVDVNECISIKKYCSVLVPCINTPGSYVCGNCPTGYSGNGIHCNDIDECEIDNGKCAVGVNCINTPGSFECGNCPPGLQGNGHTCYPVADSLCPSPWCHKSAMCLVNSIGAINCVCMIGYTGQGFGPNGCKQINPCTPNPCANGGECTSLQNSYSCQCTKGFSGKNCKYNLNITCSLKCTCSLGFNSLKCENNEECEDNNKGTFTFPNTNYDTSSNKSHECQFSIIVNEYKIIHLNFTKFVLNTSNECGAEYLMIKDGRTLADHTIGRFCGNELPHQGNIKSTHNTLVFWLKLQKPRLEQIEFSWSAVDPGKLKY